MKKVVKQQKEITNDLGDKEKLDLLIAIDNVRLIQYTCPSNEFFSVSHKDLIVYKENNTDLQTAFGSDLKKYYEHYMNTGWAEGRTH